MTKSRKITETERILDSYCAEYRDAYIIARMCLLQVMAQGVNEPHHTKVYFDKQTHKAHANDGREYIDENGTKHIKMSMTTAELDTDILLCAQDIREGLRSGKISYADYFACCSEFFPNR